MGQMRQAGQMGQAGQALALAELCWLQNEHSLELIKDNTDGERLAALGALIRQAERAALAAERRRA